MKKTILVVIISFLGFYNQAQCENFNEEQSLKNAKNAWESIFSDKKCVLLQKKHKEYEINIYELKSFEYEIVKTHSRINPYKLTVRIEIVKWSSPKRKMSVKDALANLEEKGDRLIGTGIAEYPLTGVYKLEKGRWVLSIGNKWMIKFITRARADYNSHVNISKILSIPEK